MLRYRMDRLSQQAWRLIVAIDEWGAFTPAEERAAEKDACYLGPRKHHRYLPFCSGVRCPRVTVVTNRVERSSHVANRESIENRNSASDQVGKV